MSNSLNRIKRIVTEISDMHRYGQEAGREAMVRSIKDEIAHPHPDADGSDPFAELAKVVDLEDYLEKVPARVNVQLTGSVVLEVNVESSGENLELRQTQNSIEIRFKDGKAFHIPLKDMA